MGQMFCVRKDFGFNRRIHGSIKRNSLLNTFFRLTTDNINTVVKFFQCGGNVTIDIFSRNTGKQIFSVAFIQMSGLKTGVYQFGIHMERVINQLLVKSRSTFPLDTITLYTRVPTRGSSRRNFAILDCFVGI